ncbi:MAG: phosphoserine phosphatase, partial [Sphingobacteriaceae bacterium]
INIVGEFLVTNAQIGYVITDVNAGYGQQVLTELKQIEHTIKFRLLY